MGVGVRPLVNSPVKPNHLTSLRLATGVAAAASYAAGTPNWIYTGSVLFVVSLLLDRADGILARMSGETSVAGHRYDLISDFVCTVSVFIGIGFGLRESALGEWAFPLGILAGLAVGAIMWLVMRAEAKEGPRAAEIQGAAGFDPDDTMFIVPIAMALGGGVPLIVAAAIGASGFALYFFWKFRRFLGGA